MAAPFFCVSKFAGNDSTRTVVGEPSPERKKVTDEGDRTRRIRSTRSRTRPTSKLQGSRMTADEILAQYGPREAMEYDVVVVGAGPGGLATAIGLKQLAAERGKEISVVVLEKGSEPGAHILSGAVMDPRAITELFPNWKELGAPLNQPVTDDQLLVLGQVSAIKSPVIPLCFHN